MKIKFKQDIFEITYRDTLGSKQRRRYPFKSYFGNKWATDLQSKIADPIVDMVNREDARFRAMFAELLTDMCNYMLNLYVEPSMHEVTAFIQQYHYQSIWQQFYDNGTIPRIMCWANRSAVLYDYERRGIDYDHVVWLMVTKILTLPALVGVGVSKSRLFALLYMYIATDTGKFDRHSFTRCTNGICSNVDHYWHRMTADHHYTTEPAKGHEQWVGIAPVILQGCYAPLLPVCGSDSFDTKLSPMVNDLWATFYNEYCYLVYGLNEFARPRITGHIIDPDDTDELNRIELSMLLQGEMGEQRFKNDSAHERTPDRVK